MEIITSKITQRREYDLQRKNKKYTENKTFREKLKQKNLARYYAKKEMKKFANILLD